MAQVKIKVDVSKVRSAIQSGIPLVLTTYTFPREVEEYVRDIVKVFLTELNQTQMIDSLLYCVTELANNAKKANTKRVYFEEKGLDLTKPDDYAKGMENFKSETMENLPHYLELQKNKGLYIKIILQAKNNKIKLELRNKSELSVYEYKRIHDKITRAQQYNSVEEGMAALLDDTEGAGLGLVMMILMLRNIGLAEDNFQVLSENGETITRLILPFSRESKETITVISLNFVNLIKGLPEFPENINAVNRLINDPDSQMSDIARKISNDVSLTGELLKMVNSAAFALSTPCSSVADAVKFAGIRGIRNLLFSIGSMKSLMLENDEARKKMWDHSYRVAFYSNSLARSHFSKAEDKEFVEDAYVCGLLHDMGKIIFLSAHPDTMNKMQEVCRERGVSTDLFERLIAGVNHGEIGALIAEKWNFPDTMVHVIRCHHEPELAPESKWKISALVNFSDLLAHYGEGTVDFSQFDTEVLRLFNITTPEQLEQLNDKLSQAFRNSSRS